MAACEFEEDFDGLTVPSSCPKSSGASDHSRWAENALFSTPWHGSQKKFSGFPFVLNKVVVHHLGFERSASGSWYVILR